MTSPGPRAGGVAGGATGGLGLVGGSDDAAFTVRTKLCVAVPAVLAASMVSVYVPWLPAAGVPDRVAVPSPLSMKVMPEGRAGLEVADIAAVGAPVVLTEKVPAVPTAKRR